MAPQRYEIRLEGRLGPTALAAFEDLDAGVDGHDTVLRGPIADQAALYGALERVQALGLALVGVRRLASPPPGREASRGGGAPGPGEPPVGPPGPARRS